MVGGFQPVRAPTQPADRGSQAAFTMETLRRTKGTLRRLKPKADQRGWQRSFKEVITANLRYFFPG